MLRITAILCLIATSSQAQDSDYRSFYGIENFPKTLEILDSAAAECTAQSQGQLEVLDERALTWIDLDGDAQMADNMPDDMVIDFNFIFCSTGNLWGGTGGAPVHFVLNGTTSASWTGGNWDVVRTRTLYSPVILLPRHGSACDGYGAQPCVQAIVAYEDGFSTVRFPESSEEPQAE